MSSEESLSPLCAANAAAACAFGWRAHQRTVPPCLAARRRARPRRAGRSRPSGCKVLQLASTLSTTACRQDRCLQSINWRLPSRQSTRYLQRSLPAAQVPPAARQRSLCPKHGLAPCISIAIRARASRRQGSSRRGTVSWSWGDQCRPALHQRQTGAAMVVTCCLIPCHPPHPRKPLRVAQSLSPCNAVLLLPFQDYDVSPAAARRAFRRVPSRRELSLQAVVLTLRSAAVRLFYFHTRARPATSSSPISSMW